MNWKKYWNSPTNILLAAILGILWGVFSPFSVEWMKTMGDIFIKLIRMLVVPIVFFSILSSMIKLKHTGDSSAIALKSLGIFLGLMLLAAILGVFAVQLVPDSIQVQEIPQAFLNGVELYQNKVPQSQNVLEYIFNLIPSNILEAFRSDNILQVVLFSIFLGLGLAFFPKEKKGIEVVIYTMSEVLGWMMEKVMFLVPIAVFALIGYMVSSTGFDILYQIGAYFLTYFLLILFWIYVVLWLLLKFRRGISFTHWVKTIFPLQFFALSTSSSLVSMPLNIKTAEALGASKRDASLVIPIGTTLNLQATAMYYVMSAIFFGKIFGIQFALSQYVAMIATAVLGAAAAAGVPGTSLLIAAVFVSGGVPLSALPLLFACDRFFDMVVTVGNVIGNTAVPLLVSKEKKDSFIV